MPAPFGAKFTEKLEVYRGKVIWRGHVDPGPPGRGR
jgi:hypothetical protein